MLHFQQGLNKVWRIEKARKKKKEDCKLTDWNCCGHCEQTFIFYLGLIPCKCNVLHTCVVQSQIYNFSPIKCCSCLCFTHILSGFVSPSLILLLLCLEKKKWLFSFDFFFYVHHSWQPKRGQFCSEFRILQFIPLHTPSPIFYVSVGWWNGKRDCFFKFIF